MLRLQDSIAMWILLSKAKLFFVSILVAFEVRNQADVRVKAGSRFGSRIEIRYPLHEVNVRNLERDAGQAHPAQKARLDTIALGEGKWL